jgi:hypothetical protein
MPCCRHCCHCLIRGSSGKAGVAACGGSSSSRSRDGSGDGSGAILFLVVVVILLLFACPLLGGIVLPLFVDCCSFHKPPLTRLQRAMVGCCLLLSAALFVVARCPAIIDDCVADRRPPAAGASRCSCVAGGQRLCCSLDAVILVLNVVVAGSGAGLSAGMKPWWRTN